MIDVHYEKLDVIIPTYNRAEFLEIALESICESLATWRKTIVLNNASTDNTLEVVEKIKAKYPNRKIEVITNAKNLGNAGNFHRTQEIASNYYTAVFHDDDAIHPEYIDRAMKLITGNKENVVIVSGGAIALYNVNHENWNMCPNSYWKYPANMNIFLQLLVARPVFCSSIYKTDIYKLIQYKHEEYGKLHDIIFLSEIGEKGICLFLHGECVRWRQHIDSDSNTLKTGPFPKEILNLLWKMNSMYNNETKGRGGEEKIKNIIFKTLLFNFSLFIYKWADLERFISWNKFKKEMIKIGIFKTYHYIIFNHFIDLILNPIIRKMAIKYGKKYSETYTYRVGE